MSSVLQALAAHAPEAVAAAGEAAEHAEGGLPQLDFSTFPSQIFWLLVSFVLLYVLVSTVFLPKIGKLLAEREGRIAGDLNTASALRTQAEDTGKALEVSLADARARAHAVVARQREQMAAEADAESKAAEAALEAKLAESDAAIARRKDEALSKVSEVAAGAAQALVQKLIGVTPDQADVQRALASASQDRA